MKIQGTQFARLSIVAAQNLAARERTERAQSAQNRYDASLPTSPDRSYIPGFVRDARYDANSFTRWELFRKIVNLEPNVWLIRRLKDEYVKWTVGPNGIPVLPATSDSEWNKFMLESYQEWCESPFLDSTITMPQGHRMMSGNEHLFGGLFINFTRSKLLGQPSKPAIQLIESQRCSSPGADYSWDNQGQDVIDGVQLGKDSATGKPTKPIGYWVRDGLNADEWTFRGTGDMLHVFDPIRIGQYRELTPYYNVLNPLQDLADREDLEMQRAKQNTRISNIIKNASGEMPQDQVRALRMGVRSGTQTALSSPDDAEKKRSDLYQRVLGASTIFLKTGEEIEQLDSKHPSASQQWLFRYNIAQVCASSNVPMILVFPELIESMQGTVVRGIYDNAKEFFRSKSFVFAHAARRMYRFYANWARYNDPRCVDAPADWDKCHTILPRAVNVDIGKNSAAMLAEYAAGTTNLDDIAGREGTTAEVLLTKKAMNVALAKRIAADVSEQTGQEVSAEEVMGNLADIAQKLASANVGDPNDDEPTSVPRGKKSDPELVEA